jgi:hypothetical protein
MQVWAVVRSMTGEKDSDHIHNQLNQIRGFAFENGDTIEFFIDVYKFTTTEVIKQIATSGISRVYIANLSHFSPHFDSQIAYLASFQALSIEVVSVYEKKLHVETTIEELVKAKLFSFKSDEHQINRRDSRKRTRIKKSN